MLNCARMPACTVNVPCGIYGAGGELEPHCIGWLLGEVLARMSRPTKRHRRPALAGVVHGGGLAGVRDSLLCRISRRLPRCVRMVLPSYMGIPNALAMLGSPPRARATPRRHGVFSALQPHQPRGNPMYGRASTTAKPTRHTPVRPAVGRAGGSGARRHVAGRGAIGLLQYPRAVEAAGARAVAPSKPMAHSPRPSHSLQAVHCRQHRNHGSAVD